jgi:serine/threonine protein kinase
MIGVPDGRARCDEEGLGLMGSCAGAMGFEPGQRVGDYEILRALGAGGLGAVYEVRHLISQRHEAMKILLPDQSGTPEMVERFRREVQTLATLNHQNIAQLHTAFYNESQLAMVMELIPGETLRDRRMKAQITLPEALGYVSQVLQALDYAHRLGVVHRDIKPSNIMITNGGVVKVLDFGIALTGQGSELTSAGYLLGSVNYMSPEQIGGAKATALSDLYSVGVTLYELLTGLLPITGDNNYEIMMGHVNRIPVAPHVIAPVVPLRISDAAMRALAKDPARRFANAAEFLAALQQGPSFAAEAVTSATVTALPAASVAARLFTGPGGSGSASSKLPSSSGVQNLTLEDLTRRLAEFIGPVARIVVKKLSAQSTDMEFIFHEAAKQISNEADRAAFLRAKPR